MKRLHITGCPRSGTTLLAEMARTCFRCDGADEHETSVLNKVPREARIYITKLPGELDLLNLLMPVDVSLHGVYIERDPRAVITSVHAGAVGRYATDYTTWQTSHRLAAGLASNPRFLKLRYEDLVNDPDEIQAGLMRKFPWLEKIEDFSNYHQTARSSEHSLVAMNGLRPVSSDRVASWRRNLERVKEELVRHPEMPDELIECGYERDAGWTAILQDLPLREHPVWREKTPGWLKRFDRWQRRRRKIRRALREARSQPSAERTPQS